MSEDLDVTNRFPPTSSIESMRTWTKRIRSFVDVPREFAPVFPEYHGQFPYTLFLPRDRQFKRNHMIFCVFEDHFVVLEMERNEITSFSGMFTDILYLERGKILLHSWLKIVTPAGAPSLRFTTTNDYLFEPAMARIRQGMSGGEAADGTAGEDENHSQTLSKFEFLAPDNLKYLNYGKRSVLPGDAVLGVFYQPERCVRELSLFNKTLFRWYTTAHLSIFTERELILIREKKRIKTKRDTLYGAIFSFIPRRRIQGISFTEDGEKARYIMEITLPGNTHLTSEFSANNGDLEQLQEAVKAVSVRGEKTGE